MIIKMRFILTPLAFATLVAAAVIAPAPVPDSAPALAPDPTTSDNAEPVILRAVTKRQVNMASLTPGLNVHLEYSGEVVPNKPLPIPIPINAPPVTGSPVSGSPVNAAPVQSSLPILPSPKPKVGLGISNGVTSASVSGKMKVPSILLEEIPSIRGVSCATKGSIKVPFTDPSDFASVKEEWPANGFVVVTTSEGSCAADGQRGWYTVRAIKYDDTSQTATITADTSALQDIMEDAEVYWQTTKPKTDKRSLDIGLSMDLSGKQLVNQGPFSVRADEAKYTGDISINGKLKYNFVRQRLSEMSVDLLYNADLALNYTTAIRTTKRETQSLKFEPLDATVSGFSLPGILDVGPMLSFGMGIELSASGSVTVKTGFTTSVRDSSVHLDFLDPEASTATGWMPVTTTVDNKFSVDASLQVNPYAELRVGMGVKAFSGLVDLSASVATKPKLVNSFNAHAEATSNFMSDTGLVTFAAPKNAAKDCKNGAWFASTLQFGVVASIGPYSANLYSTKVPVYESQCFDFNILKRDEELVSQSPRLNGKKFSA